MQYRGMLGTIGTVCAIGAVVVTAQGTPPASAATASARRPSCARELKAIREVSRETSVTAGRTTIGPISAGDPREWSATLWRGGAYEASSAAGDVDNARTANAFAVVLQVSAVRALLGKGCTYRR